MLWVGGKLLTMSLPINLCMLKRDGTKRLLIDMMRTDIMICHKPIYRFLLIIQIEDKGNSASLI